MGGCFSTPAHTRPAAETRKPTGKGCFGSGVKKMLSPLPSVKQRNVSAKQIRQERVLKIPPQYSPWLASTAGASEPVSEGDTSKPQQRRRGSRSHGNIHSLLLPKIESYVAPEVAQRSKSAPLLHRHGLTAIQAEKLTATTRSLDVTGLPNLKPQWQLATDNFQDAFDDTKALRGFPGDTNAKALAFRMHLSLQEGNSSGAEYGSFLTSGMDSYFEGEGSEFDEFNSGFGAKYGRLGETNSARSNGRGKKSGHPGAEWSSSSHSEAARSDQDQSSSPANSLAQRLQRRRRRVLTDVVEGEGPEHDSGGYTQKTHSGKSSHSSRDLTIANELFRSLWTEGVKRRQQGSSSGKLNQSRSSAESSSAATVEQEPAGAVGRPVAEKKGLPPLHEVPLSEPPAPAAEPSRPRSSRLHGLRGSDLWSGGAPPPLHEVPVSQPPASTAETDRPGSSGTRPHSLRGSGLWSGGAPPSLQKIPVPQPPPPSAGGLGPRIRESRPQNFQRAGLWTGGGPPLHAARFQSTDGDKESSFEGGAARRSPERGGGLEGQNPMFGGGSNDSAAGILRRKLASFQSIKAARLRLEQERREEALRQTRGTAWKPPLHTR